jgi:hypothetical protein
MRSYGKIKSMLQLNKLIIQAVTELFFNQAQKEHLQEQEDLPVNESNDHELGEPN